MKPNPRLHRVADEIQRILSGLIRTQLKDPRVHMVTITDVKVSSDMSHAKVFVTTLDALQDDAAANARRTQSLVGLVRASGFLRSELSRRLSVRLVPQLHFVYDESIERAARLSNLIDRAVSEDTQRASRRLDDDNQG